MIKVITTEKFWDLFAEELPNYVHQEPNPKECYSQQRQWTETLLGFFQNLTEKLNRNLNLNLELIPIIERDRIDFSYYLDNKVYIAVESENVPSSNIESEIIHFDSVRDSCKLNVLIWYYKFRRINGNTTKDKQLTKIKNLVKNYNLSNLLLILGPDLGMPIDAENYFRLLDGRDYQAYKFESDGQYEELENKNILQLF